MLGGSGSGCCTLKIRAGILHEPVYEMAKPREEEEGGRHDKFPF